MITSTEIVIVETNEEIESENQKPGAKHNAVTKMTILFVVFGFIDDFVL